MRAFVVGTLRTVPYRPGCSKLARSACHGHHPRASKARRDPTKPIGAIGLWTTRKTQSCDEGPFWGFRRVSRTRITPSAEASGQGGGPSGIFVASRQALSDEEGWSMVLFAEDIAIDLGTANTLVSVK